MTSDLPSLYFRIRENGAAVFRVGTENRQRRIEMEQIATVNVRTGDIRPTGDRTIPADELARIADWTRARQTLVAAREVDDILRAVDTLNLTAQWVLSRATPDQLEAVTDDLLLAMHDLRTVLVKKKADRLVPRPGSEPE